jgi:hypothetical protein
MIPIEAHVKRGGGCYMMAQFCTLNAIFGMW